MEKQEAVSLIVYYEEKNKPMYLLLKYNIHGQKHWDFIKGKIKKGESEIETILREAEEETGLKNFKMEKFRDEFKYDYKKDTGEKVEKKVIYLLGKISKEESEPINLSEEHNKYQWADYETSMKILEFQNQKETLTKINNYIKKR